MERVYFLKALARAARKNYNTDIRGLFERGSISWYWTTKRAFLTIGEMKFSLEDDGVELTIEDDETTYPFDSLEELIVQALESSPNKGPGILLQKLLEIIDERYAIAFEQFLLYADASEYDTTSDDDLETLQLGGIQLKSENGIYRVGDKQISEEKISSFIVQGLQRWETKNAMLRKTYYERIEQLKLYDAFETLKAEIGHEESLLILDLLLIAQRDKEAKHRST